MGRVRLGVRVRVGVKLRHFHHSAVNVCSWDDRSKATSAPRHCSCPGWNLRTALLFRLIRGNRAHLGRRTPWTREAEV